MINIIIFHNPMEKSGTNLPNIRKFLGPANPIITKLQEQPALEDQRPPPEDVDSSEDDLPLNQTETLFNSYAQKNLVFTKWANRNTTRNKVNYFGSHFFQNWEKEKCKYVGQTAEESLSFDSSFQGANLLSVYKLGEDKYHLVLQNDTNSGGYTQWFNFRVSNGKRRGSVTFSIVNLYKKRTLYKEGMKPLARSLVNDKNWKRSCHGIEYFANEMRMEGRKGKYYKTLSFKYDFNFNNDTVQFSSCYPYSYADLCQWLQTLDSPKLRIKELATTSISKVIRMLHISASSGRPKRAVVLMGRQHPGQTPSSFVLQTMVEELLGSSSENEFLLANFEFFVFPMVNVDGVAMGNYRCNLAGYDLNRCWNSIDCKDKPEILCITNQIKKIQKKMPIELILDIHGHSSKLNSFFYGNNFGKNNMAFPLVASKMHPFIDIASCTVSTHNAEKANTARVVLGNLIRETGATYTFEISLFAGIRNGKKIHLLVEHYQELAKSLLSALNKCEVEIFKEERSLKGSLFLKEMRRELKRIEKDLTKEEPESDEEARRTTSIEENSKGIRKASQPQQLFQKKRLAEIEEEVIREAGTSTEQFLETDYIPSQGGNERQGRKRGERQSRARGSERRRVSFSIRKVFEPPEERKDFLMHKLRIFGETFLQPKLEPLSLRPPPPVHTSAQTDLTLKELTAYTERLLQRVPQNRIVLNCSNALRRESPRQNEFKSRLTARGSKSNPASLDASDLSFGVTKYKGYQ